MATHATVTVSRSPMYPNQVWLKIMHNDLLAAEMLLDPEAAGRLIHLISRELNAIRKECSQCPTDENDSANSPRPRA